MFNDVFPIEWELFHFLRPHFLWLFIPIGVLMLLGWYSQRQEVQWKKVIAPHLRSYVIKNGTGEVKFRMNMVLMGMLSLGTLSLSGPTWKKIQVPGQQLETPMVILLDLSQSMMAEDLQPNRLERAKFKIKDLLDYQPGARVALIGYAGTAHIIVPLTRDYEIINNHLMGLKPSVVPYPGSNLQAALSLSDTLTSITKAPGSILLFSDDFLDAHFELIQSYTQHTGNTVIVMPISTVAGSEIPSFNGAGVLLDKSGKKVHSSLNNNVLAKLDGLEKVEVHFLTLDDIDVEVISDNISKNLEFTDKPEEKEDNWRDFGLLFLLPVVVLLLFWFRRGWVLYSFIFLFLTSCSDHSTFSDLWYAKDYQGQKLSEKGNYIEAATTYNNSMRSGVAWFKAGNYDEAIKAFSNDTTAKGTYNLGLAYLKNGDTLSAKLAFGMAVEMDSTFEQARSNQKQLAHYSAGSDEADPKDANEVKEQAQNKQNESMEDLSGGGQEATKEDMQKERQEETVTTNVRKAKELDEVPDDIGSSIQQQNSNILLRKVDDDPSEFLKRKFVYQAKKYQLQPHSNDSIW